MEIAERSMDHDSIDAAQARRAMNLAGDSIDEGYMCRQPITICFPVSGRRDTELLHQLQQIDQQCISRSSTILIMLE